jgi:hypothetical protein
MGQPRADGLPNPVTGEQAYLAAILDELRGLAHAASSPAVEGETEVVDLREPTAPVDNSDVSEAEASEAARVLAASDEVASEAGRTLAAHQHQEKPAEPEPPEDVSIPATPKRVAKPRAKRTTKKRASK